MLRSNLGVMGPRSERKPGHGGIAMERADPAAEGVKKCRARNIGPSIQAQNSVAGPAAALKTDWESRDTLNAKIKATRDVGIVSYPLSLSVVLHSFLTSFSATPRPVCSILKNMYQRSRPGLSSDSSFSPPLRALDTNQTTHFPPSRSIRLESTMRLIPLQSQFQFHPRLHGPFDLFLDVPEARETLFLLHLLAYHMETMTRNWDRRDPTDSLS